MVLVPRIAGIIQLAICAFIVADYVEDRENLPLTIVAGGLLAITAFGLLGKRRWAVPAAVAVNTPLVVILWIVALDRRTFNVVVGAAVLSVPWLLLFPVWLRERTRRRSVADKHRPGAHVTQSHDPPEPSGWTREWGGGRVKFGALLFFGTLCLFAGLGILRDGEVALGVSILGFGVALVGGAPMLRTWDRDGHISVAVVPGRGERGLVFPYSRSKTVAAMLASVGMAVACGAIPFGGLTEGDRHTPTGLVIFGVFGFVFFGWIALMSLRRNGVRAGFVALTRSGIVGRLPVMECFVPWDAITDVEDVEMTVHVRGTTTREPFIGLRISDLDRVEMPAPARFFTGLDNRFLGTDINFPVRTLDVDPRLLLAAIKTCWKTPASRASLGTSRSLPETSPGSRSDERESADSPMP